MSNLLLLKCISFFSPLLHKLPAIASFHSHLNTFGDVFEKLKGIKGFKYPLIYKWIVQVLLFHNFSVFLHVFLDRQRPRKLAKSFQATHSYKSIGWVPAKDRCEHCFLFWVFFNTHHRGGSREWVQRVRNFPFPPSPPPLESLILRLCHSKIL